MSEAENSMDTAESTAASTSAEDRFFGVKTQIAKKSDQEATEQTDLNFEIADENPPSAKKATDDGAADDELDGYSKKVRRRIDKATFERREAERLADEAVKAAQQLNQQNQQLAAKNKEYESLINRGETALVSQIKEKAQLAADKAKSEYRKAYEEGNTDNIVSSQEQMIQAQSELQGLTNRQLINSSRRLINSSKRFISNRRLLMSSSKPLPRLPSLTRRQQNGERKILGLGTGGIRG